MNYGRGVHWPLEDHFARWLYRDDRPVRWLVRSSTRAHIDDWLQIPKGANDSRADSCIGLSEAGVANSNRVVDGRTENSPWRLIRLTGIASDGCPPSSRKRAPSAR